MSEKIIKEAFSETCSMYERILKSYYPSFGNTGFTERNITFNFCNAFLKKSNDENLIVWQEVPIKNKNDENYTEHFDSLIIDDHNHKLFLIEAKRLNETRKEEDINSDLVRIKDKWSTINFGEKNDRKTYSKYLLILADIWMPYGKKSKTKLELFNWFRDYQLDGIELFDYGYLEIKKNGQALTDKERYFLMYKVWKIK